MNKFWAVFGMVVFWCLTLGTMITGRLYQVYSRGDEWWRIMQEVGFGLGIGLGALVLCIALIMSCFD